MAFIEFDKYGCSYVVFSKKEKCEIVKYFKILYSILLSRDKKVFSSDYINNDYLISSLRTIVEKYLVSDSGFVHRIWCGFSNVPGAKEDINAWNSEVLSYSLLSDFKREEIKRYTLVECFRMWYSKKYTIDEIKRIDKIMMTLKKKFLYL